MKEIIEILSENNLYVGSKDNIISYKKDAFLANYKLNRSPKNIFPKHIKRYDSGYLVLDNEPFILTNKREPGNSNTIWILLSNGARVLLKEIPRIERENELLFKELCKELDVPCANSDIVTLDGKIYFASLSFLGINEHLEDYYKLDRKAIVDTVDLITDAKEINQDAFIRKALTCDILSENIDRLPNNLRVIRNKKQRRICPLFDNGLLREGKAKITTPWINGSYDNDDIIEFLMQDEHYRTWAFNKIISKQMPNYKKKILEEKKIYIDDKNYKYFEESLENGKVLVLNAYKNS